MTLDGIDKRQTPGPWYIRPWFDDKAMVVTIDEKTCDVSSVIAKVEASHNSPDAQLIASSPALLTACEAVEAKLDRLLTIWGDHKETRELRDQVTAAIRSAKGGDRGK